MRTTRKETPILYKSDDEFVIGGSRVIRHSNNDVVTVVAAGITLHEALKAYEDLKKEEIHVRVIDLYSIKPIDGISLRKAAEDTGTIITVEDHFAEGGIGDAVRSSLTQYPVPIHSLAVRKMPRSGKPDELLDYEEVSKTAIIKKIRSVI